MKIQVETNWPQPNLWPNARAHRMAVYRAQSKAHEEAFWSTRIVRPKDWQSDGGRLKLTIEAQPKTNGNFDDDNLIAAAKCLRDGIAEALGIDDKLFVVQPVKRGDLSHRGKLLFTVEPLQ